MKQTLKNYRMSIIMMAGIVLGAVIGIVFKEKATALNPFGDLFLNMLLVIIVPLIFLTISTSIGSVNSAKRVGKILVAAIGVFLATSLVSAVVGIVSSRITLVNPADGKAILEALDNSASLENDGMNMLQRITSMISTNDFAKLLSRDNIIALIVISILVGISIQMAGEKGKAFLNVLDSANEVLQKLIQLIMYYAPIGILCYFAAFVGSFGASIAVGYLKTLVIYCISCIFIYFVVYSAYAFLAAGKNGFKAYWRNIIPPTLTALATCSSAACIPVNTKCAQAIGCPADIANTTIPLGTSFHKDGSIVGSVFKIMFLVYLFDADVSFGKVLLLTLVATVMVTAVPIGGGTISEMLIITMLGFPVAALPILTIIATIIDAPATILNVVGDSANSMLVSRIIEGKGWMKKKA